MVDHRARTAARDNHEFPKLPHDAAAESAVLGTILLTHSIPESVNYLKSSQFFDDRHQRIFRSMQTMDAMGTWIDEICLLDVLGKDAGLAGGPAYIASLADGRQSLTDLGHYVAIIQEKALLRTLMRYGETIQRQVSEGENADAILDRADTDMRQLLEMSQEQSGRSLQLGSVSTAELFAAQETKIDWLAWPIAAMGLTSILDAPPKLGKTRLLLEAIRASRMSRTFLNCATKPMRVVYVSEQSEASLAMQTREVGFTGDEPIEELRWITREFWSRFIFAEFLERLEKQFLVGQNYNALIFDTWHTIARLEDENAASEVNRFGNLTIDLATRNHLALPLGRHDRKSGGEVGMSGRSSIQLSGLVDVILHLVRIPGQPNQRKLELLGRVPGLPNEQLIELSGGMYINRGVPEESAAAVADRVAMVRDWLDAEPKLSAPDIVNRFASMVPSIEIGETTAKRYRGQAKKHE